MRMFIVPLKQGRRLFSFFALGFLGMVYFLCAAPEINEPIRKGADDSNVALCCNVFWGEEYLPDMLKILDEENVKITFFIGGTWAKENQELLREIKDKGHELGNHSYNHPHVNELNKVENQQQIIKTADLVKEICDYETKLYAPPYGEYNNTVLQAAEELGYPVILWSIDTVDWKRPPPELIVQRVKNRLHNGAIILIHPTKPTATALKEVIVEIKKQNYNIRPLSEVIKDNENQ